MYTLSVKRDFVARHFLVGGDWGQENKPHSHHYQVEVQMEGRELDQHGYLVDIVDIKSRLDGLAALFRDETLNNFPEFEGLNPSLENFARIFCQALLLKVDPANLKAITVKIWEDADAWATYRQEL
jgi:6-pyruvoyltetrahydropterin/6-carboxytetrahydropterin synthase